MKTAILAAAALLMTTGATLAAPRHFDRHDNGANRYERVAIARSAANLAALKHYAWRDGKLSFIEKFQIRNAERRHASLMRRAYRS